MTWNYCPICGSALVKRGDQVHGICPKCERPWYINPKPTVAIIIYDPLNPWSVLLGVRNKPPKKGYLDVLGGFVNPNETFEQAAVRELSEEIGIKVSTKDLRFFCHMPSDDYEYKGERYFTLDACFLLALPGDTKFSIDQELSSLVWWDLKRKGMPKIAFKGNARELKRYFKALHGCPLNT